MSCSTLALMQKWMASGAHIDNANTLYFPDWLSAYTSINDGEIVEVIEPDGFESDLSEDDEDEGINAMFGDMIRDLILELKDEGELGKLPLAEKAFMVIEEFDGRYFWPTRETRKTKGRILT